MSRAIWIACLVAGCGGGGGGGGPHDAPQLNGDGVPYCWIYDCPTDPGAEVCGTCTSKDTECPPGFVCSICAGGVCMKGPRNFDARPSCDAAPAPFDAGPGPDAFEYDWPVCDPSHIPGT